MIEYSNIILNNKDYINLIHSDVNASSFMFISEDEVFLRNFSYMFAKFLLCENNSRPCGNCISCKKVDMLSHSDMILLPKTHKNVLVEDIKTLIENIYLAPLESDRKVFIIDNFSLATTGAQNKLLKILEEPPKNSYIILNVTSESKVLNTIKSRCKKLRLSPLSNKELSQATSINPDSEIFSIAQGNLTKALRYGGDEDFANLYSSCLQTLQDMKDSKQLIKYSSILSKNKEDIDLVLDILESMFNDLLYIRLNKDNFVKNTHILSTLKQISSEYTSSSIDYILKKIIETRKSLDFNCNYTFLIDALLLYILEVKFLCKE